MRACAKTAQDAVRMARLGRQKNSPHRKQKWSCIGYNKLEMRNRLGNGET
jgi:hypothetical protein